ncbi:hypothetical protein HMPREF2532_04648 [Bacteroides ovatus]|nr:hypothetical protein HMPREF2532_04648 [Bacteroides ovatus]
MKTEKWSFVKSPIFFCSYFLSCFLIRIFDPCIKRVLSIVKS